MGSLRLVDISKRFDRVEALKDVDLEIYDGEYAVVLGPTGAGKTTLLRIIAGLLRQDNGEVYINEVQVDDLPPEERGVALFFQNFALFPHMTVLDNVAFSLRVKGLSLEESERKAMDILRMVHLDHRAYSYPRELSGGMQQRVALARTIAAGVDILLLDEPLSQLDAKIKSEIQYELRDLAKSLGLTVLHVTNDVEEALAVADRIAILNKGEIVQVGTPVEIMENPKTAFVASFIAEMNLMEGVVEESSENRVVVDIGGGFKVESSRNGFKKGELVIVGVKPSSFKIGGDGKNGLTGKVEDWVFSFGFRRVTVQLDNGSRVSVKTERKDIKRGSPISLTVDPRDVYLFPYLKGGLRTVLAEVSGVF